MLERLRKTGCLMCMLLVILLCGCHGEDDEVVNELDEAASAQEEQKKSAGEEQAGTEEISEGISDKTISGEDTDKTDRQQEMYIHVCGQVHSPGVYRLPAGSRVFEAVEAAGGMKEGADGAYLNQAEILKDGQQLYVPAQGESVQRAETAAADPAGEDGTKVDINRAAKEELMTLNGIGEARAESIIKYREEHGGFRSAEELKEVEGIKEGIFNKIKDQIKV